MDIMEVKVCKDIKKRFVKMNNKINRELAYENLNKYLKISKKQINKLNDDQLGILLNFVSNEITNKIKK